MNDWKTTVVGLLGAVLVAINDVLANGASLADWQTYIVPVAIAALGYFAGDKNKAVK